MKFGIVRERKNPPDRRVVFSPDALAQLQTNYPKSEWVVESSPIRIFSDDEYRAKGIEVVDNLSDCDVLFGVKEIPIDALIPNKNYFFFSHTIKMQPHNQKLLRALLDKNITLFDHETIVDAQDRRLIGFGFYAGVVGAYNGFRAFGTKFELFDLPKAENLAHQEELIASLKRHMLPPIKIVLTGHGKVAQGALAILDGIKVKKVSIDDFLKKTYDRPVYTQIDVLDYNKRIDGQVGSKSDFYEHPELYCSDFERFSEVTDLFMAGHFYAPGAPVILSQEMLQSPKCAIKVVADISCDVEGPIACTVRASTIADPIYGYLPSTGEEVSYRHPSAIVVMAVDNLPCELPKDASIGFGAMFVEHVIPAFFNNDEDQLLRRAMVVTKGQLTPKFEYLTDYANESTVILPTS